MHCTLSHSNNPCIDDSPDWRRHGQGLTRLRLVCFVFLKRSEQVEEVRYSSNNRTRNLSRYNWYVTPLLRLAGGTERQFARTYFPLQAEDSGQICNVSNCPTRKGRVIFRLMSAIVIFEILSSHMGDRGCWRRHRIWKHIDRNRRWRLSVSLFEWVAVE